MFEAFFELAKGVIALKTDNKLHKLFYGLLLILFLLWVNDYYSITKNILINRRLEQFEKLKVLSPQTFEQDSLVQKELIQIRNSLFEKENFTDKARYFITRQFTGIFTWRNFSACCIFLIAMFIIPIEAIRKKIKPDLNNIVRLITGELILLTCVMLMIRLLGLIPTFGWIFFNHFLNISIQFAFIRIIFPKSNTENKYI